MPTKPTDNVPEFAANTNFTVGPVGIITTPTRNATALMTAVANGAVPWYAESPLTGQHFNEWMHRGWALLDWVYQGTAFASDDAHIVETKADGGVELTTSAPFATTLSVQRTTAGGIAIDALSQDAIAIGGGNDSSVYGAVIAQNSSLNPFAKCFDAIMAAGFQGAGYAVSMQAGDTMSVGYRVSAWPASAGVGVSLDMSGAIGSAVGMDVDMTDAGTDALAQGVRIRAADGTLSALTLRSSGDRVLTRYIADAGADALSFVEYAAAAGSVAQVTAYTRATINADNKANTFGHVVTVGRASCTGYAATVSTNDSYGVRVEVTNGNPSTRGIFADTNVSGASAIEGQANGASTAGITAHGLASGTGLVVRANNGAGSPMRYEPQGTAPTVVGGGNVYCKSVGTTFGLQIHDGTDWRRIAHTARRYREPACGYDADGSHTGPTTSGIIADATFTAADGGDVIVTIAVSLSQTALQYCELTVESDDGAGAAVQTILANRKIAFTTTANASTERSRTWAFRHKVSPLNTGARRYYFKIDPHASDTVYWSDACITVEGELTP